MNLHFNDTIFVSDPCYDIDTWCAHKVDNVLSGKYAHNIEIADTGDWGERVSFIRICHEDYKNQLLRFELLSSNIGVDSGQAGFFDYKAFADQRKDDQKHYAFYDECCDRTMDKIHDENQDHQGGVLTDGSGVVSSSGYGDGCYDLYGARNKDGKIVAMYIDFLVGDEDDEEDEDDYEEDKV